MNSELFDLLLESSANDMKNASILYETEMYYYSYQMYLQALKKILNVIHTHINNRQNDDVNDISIESWGKGYLPKYLIEYVNEIHDRSLLINDECEKDLLKEAATDIAKKVSDIFSVTKDLLLGKNISLT